LSSGRSEVQLQRWQPVAHQRASACIAGIVLAVVVALVSGCARQAGPTSPVSFLRSQPLWSASGAELLVVASSSGLSRTALVCFDAATYDATVVARWEGDSSALSAWAWSSKPGRVCWVSLNVKGDRRLHCAGTDGRGQQQIDLPLRTTVGLECTAAGRVVVVDQDEPTGGAAARPSSTVRVFTESLQKQSEFAVPYAVQNVQVNPALPESIIALANSDKVQVVLDIDAGRGQFELLGTVDGIDHSGGRWKCTANHRVYYTPAPGSSLRPGSLYAWETGTGKSRMVVPGSRLGGEISRFDIARDKAVVTSGKQLYLFHLKNGRVERLTHDAHSYAMPQLSPDAGRVAAIRDMREVVVIDLATGEMRVL